MSIIDATARIADGARLADDVEIGPFCSVGPKVELGPGVRLISHVSIVGCTSIGARTVAYPFVSLGTPPQSARYRGGDTRLVIGADCVLREGFTANTGTEDGGGVTRIGDGCFMMVGSHVAHDCQVGNQVTFANNAVIAGHVTVGDYAVFGGQAAVRQFVRIGRGVMIAGLTGIRADVIPWGIVEGRKGRLAGLNVVGMKRRGFSREEIRELRRAYQQVFFGEDTFRARVDAISATASAKTALVAEVLDFIKAAHGPVTFASKLTEK